LATHGCSAKAAASCGVSCRSQVEARQARRTHDVGFDVEARIHAGLRRDVDPFGRQDVVARLRRQATETLPAVMPPMATATTTAVSTRPGSAAAEGSGSSGPRRSRAPPLLICSFPCSRTPFRFLRASGPLATRASVCATSWQLVATALPTPRARAPARRPFDRRHPGGRAR
jgi:hypothetical protein